MKLKTLLLVRHAKSCWKDESLADIDRPLNARGRANAPVMGQRLLLRKQIPEVSISSPALRTLATAKAFATELSYATEDIVIIDDLYHGSEDEVLDIVDGLSVDIRTAMIVIHNPTITQIANRFALEDVDNVPTCGVLTITAGSWAQLKLNGHLMDFDYPKRLTN